MSAHRDTTCESGSIPLPTDVLILVMQILTYEDLLALAGTCKFFNALVHEFGWSAYLRFNERPSFSLHGARDKWDALSRGRYNALSDHAWSRSKFIARPLSRPWTGNLQPVLAISTSRLLVAAGSTIDVYRFTLSHRVEEAPGMLHEAEYILRHANHTKRDITSIVFVPDNGLDHTVFVGFEDGTLERLVLPIPSPKAQTEGRTFAVLSLPQDPYAFHGDDLVESMACGGNNLLILSSMGSVSLCDLASNPLTTSSINLQTRSWSTHLSMKSSSPYAVFGTSSATPLAVHAIANTALSAKPSALLQPRTVRKFSAVYGISGAPASSPWGCSDQIVVSGWYDGAVRVHDLRSSTRASQGDAEGPAALLPVLSLHDPWSSEPIYSVSCGGGSSSHIAAGSARHSVVAFWDVRSPSKGWSVHGPGNDPSPVYALILESSRLFGATQSRPFVYDFGPGVTEDTYPLLPLPPSRSYDASRLKKNGLGYYVTKYHHNRTQE